MNPTTIDIAASKDSTHPAFHFNFGKVLATVMLGLQVYAAESASGGPAAFFTNPTNDANIINGFASIWVTK